MRIGNTTRPVFRVVDIPYERANIFIIIVKPDRRSKL